MGGVGGKPAGSGSHPARPRSSVARGRGRRRGSARCRFSSLPRQPPGCARRGAGAQQAGGSRDTREREVLWRARGRGRGGGSPSGTPARALPPHPPTPPAARVLARTRPTRSPLQSRRRRQPQRPSRGPGPGPGRAGPACPALGKRETGRGAQAAKKGAAASQLGKRVSGKRRPPAGRTVQTGGIDRRRCLLPRTDPAQVFVRSTALI